MSSAVSVPPNPFPPGESPFHAKGVVWLAAQQTMDERVPGGVAAVCEARPEYHEFLCQMFIASGYYDILPIATLAQTAAELARTTANEYVRKSGTRAAERWMKGIHKSLLSKATPLDVCKRFASVMRQLYDFGNPQIVSISEKSVQVLTSGIPEPIAWWWMTSTMGYVEVLVRAAGGRNGGIRFDKHQVESERDGVRVLQIPNTTYWD